MSPPFELRIAGIRLSVSSRLPLLPRNDCPAYADFLRPARRAEPDAAVVLSRLPRDAGHPRTAPVFDSGSSWRTFREGGDYVFSYDSAGARRRPFWRARLNGAFSRCEVQCGGELVRRRGGAPALVDPVRYPLDQILLMHILARRGGALLHAAGAVVGGAGVLFPGRSGAGKSTIARLLEGRGGWRVLSDDRIAARRGGGAIRLYGTPWPGDAGIARNESAPLRAVFFAGPGRGVRIDRVEPAEAAEMLFPAASVPWYDRALTARIFSFVGSLVQGTPAYRLRYRPSPEVADVLADAVSA